MLRVVIPARYGSTRLPGKALLPISGRPMLQWVHERAVASGAGEVIVATDDDRIATAARGFGADVEMTAASHESGSDRIAEVARRRRWPEGDLLVNLQGDEPLMPPALLAQVAELLAGHPGADMATLAAPIRDLQAFLDPNVVKVVCDDAGRALYFSRAPIPWSRDGAQGGIATQSRHDGARRHVGLYAYRVGALLRLASLPPAALELAERLEQLRALQAGFDIRVADCREPPGPDVNTASDLEKAAARLATQPRR